MGALERVPAIKAEVVSDTTVMSGDPVVKGTRILAETILGYLRADCSPQAILTRCCAKTRPGLLGLDG